jgi:hypothetical protein
MRATLNPAPPWALVLPRTCVSGFAAESEGPQASERGENETCLALAA